MFLFKEALCLYALLFYLRAYNPLLIHLDPAHQAYLSIYSILVPTISIITVQTDF